MGYVLHARIRRDAHTTTPVTVRPHEVAILQTIHGEENVQTADGQVLDLKQLHADDIAGQVRDSDDEYGRLAVKYGGNEEGLLVELVYGKKAAGGLESAVERLQKVAEKVAPTEEGGDGGADAVQASRGRGRGSKTTTKSTVAGASDGAGAEGMGGADASSGSAG